MTYLLVSTFLPALPALFVVVLLPSQDHPLSTLAMQSQPPLKGPRPFARLHSALLKKQALMGAHLMAFVIQTCLALVAITLLPPLDVLHALLASLEPSATSP